MGRRISRLVMVLVMLAGVLSAHATITPARHRHKMVAASTSHRLVAAQRSGNARRRLRMYVVHASRHRTWGDRACEGPSGTCSLLRGAVYGEQLYRSESADDDDAAGEDPVVRAAAMQALGNMNGTALAIDPSSGRILAMVNQKLALSAGAEPCSTIKVAVALAALKEGLVKADTPVNLGGHYSLDLTHALARVDESVLRGAGARDGL